MQARGSYLHKSILDATRAIFFFGTPRTGELKEVVNVDASGRESNLIMQLKEGSESLAKQQEDLLCIWEFKQKVVIFSETEKTPLIRKVMFNPFLFSGCLFISWPRASLVSYIKRFKGLSDSPSSIGSQSTKPTKTACSLLLLWIQPISPSSNI